jgi:MFS superfamily sulfate permease-like transporter
LVSVLASPSILNLIPLASLAVILIMVGFKLAKPSLFKQMYRLGWQQFVPFLVTIGAILVTDLLVGICIGMGMAVFLILRSHYLNAFSFHTTMIEDELHLKLTLAEEISFLNKASLLKQLRELPDGAEVELDASDTVHIDHDVLEMIHYYREKAIQRNIIIKMTGFPAEGEIRTPSSKQQTMPKPFIS